MPLDMECIGQEVSWVKNKTKQETEYQVTGVLKSIYKQ